ncbi:glycerol-3-phosphate acyltransferase [Bacillus sp. FJAT-18017]|uniref:glycerol-3-phosphate 1-O-acyltransferase PlsY n=1 Tax=Bacillus sp. FJAT-18017 TaxID=1705566 RepID=UPI0006AE5DE1|nr:glycerol-3-phosphate 1-O-acyltransferase PlsY [Bacillus sp. FJAT-18017]ALC90335.1 glycerol-3-phosphate acyltransferase [Bacillus sp. FJAT-18017]
MVELILLCLLAYLLGSIPSGLIIGKVFYKTDIRQHGSGNLGGTNTFRTLGKKAGFVVTFADILKGTLAAALPILLDIDNIHPLLTGMLAVVGHMYPVFAGFKGGKAVATSGGVLLFYAPLMFAIMLAIFFITLYISKYVSLASMMGGVAAVAYSLVVPPRDVPLIIIVLLLTTFVFYRHRANIGRIINKTEPKVKWL